MQGKPTPEVACRIICIFHAVEVCVLSAVSNFVVGPWAYNSVGEANTPLQSAILEISLGYFVFDLAWCVLVGNETKTLMVTVSLNYRVCCRLIESLKAHHATSIGLCFFGLALDASGAELVGGLFGAGSLQFTAY